MDQVKIVWVGGIFLILFGAVLFWITSINQKITDLERAYIIQPVSQSTTERNWRDIEFEQIATTTDLINPLHLKSYMKDYYLIGDFGDMKIKKIDQNGNLVDEFGKGLGRGPGEISNIFDLHIDAQYKIWVTDVRNARVTIFENRESWEIIEHNFIPGRTIPIDYDHYVIKPRFSTTPELRNLSGTLKKSFEQLVDEPLLWTNVLDAFFAKDSDKGIIRINYTTNDIVRYDMEGKIEFFRKSIEPPELPVILPPRKYSEDQTFVFNEPDPNSIQQTTPDINIVNDQIHLLVIVGDDQSFIDVYAVNTGSYLYSYKPPVSLKSFALTERRFAGLHIDSADLTIWNINEEL